MANDDSLMTQDDIERLFRQKKDTAVPAKTSPKMPERAGGKVDQPLPTTKLRSCWAKPAAAPPNPAQDRFSTRLAHARRSRLPQPPVSPGCAGQDVAAAQPLPQPDIAAHDIEYLLTQAEKALQSVDSGPTGEVPAGVSSYRLPEFSPAARSMETATLDLVAMSNSI